MCFLWVAVSYNLFKQTIFLIRWYVATKEKTSECVCVTYLCIWQKQAFGRKVIPELHIATDYLLIAWLDNWSSSSLSLWIFSKPSIPAQESQRIYHNWGLYTNDWLQRVLYMRRMFMAYFKKKIINCIPSNSWQSQKQIVCLWNKIMNNKIYHNNNKIVHIHCIVEKEPKKRQWLRRFCNHSSCPS